MMGQQTASKIAKLLMIVALVLAMPIQSVCWAAIPRTSATSIYEGEELDLSQIFKVESERDIRQSDVAQVIPTDMHSSQDSSDVGRQIADHAFTHWMNSANGQNSPLGRSAQTLEKHMQTDMILGHSADNSVEHKLKFKLDPTEAAAIMKYSGAVDAHVSYKAFRSEWNLEVSHKVNNSADLVVSRIDRPVEHINQVSMRWSF